MELEEIEIVNWLLDSISIKFFSELDLLRLNLAIFTMYEELKNDWMLSFVELIPTQTPQDADFILLALILQSDLEVDQETVDIVQRYDATKWNINKKFFESF